MLSEHGKADARGAANFTSLSPPHCISSRFGLRLHHPEIDVPLRRSGPLLDNGLDPPPVSDCDQLSSGLAQARSNPSRLHSGNPDRHALNGSRLAPPQSSTTGKTCYRVAVGLPPAAS